MTDEITKRVYDELSSFKGEDSLQRLISSILNYKYISDKIPTREWPDGLKQPLAEAKFIAKRPGFQVAYARMKGDKLLKTYERELSKKLDSQIGEHLLVVSNEDGSYWHFINVKERTGKRVLRRIVIGEHERLRTAPERIAMLRYETGTTATRLKELQDKAFDVEKVTRDFYKEYKEVFEYVESKIKGIKDQEAKRLFTQKLFNRLMFIAFIQKKGWLNYGDSQDYLHALWEGYKLERSAGDNFYSQKLKILFFTGLNNPSGKGVTSSKTLRDLIGEVPYLNGGLFEEEEDDRLDGVIVPDKVIEVILENLFNRFNFTVTESTPIEQEVAIDPEMLGKVFEELVTGRKESGSYYTPKTVVSFMSREAIKGFLGGYEDLINENELGDISVKTAKELLSKLSRVKICDPACGSGAYLVGMLHEIHSLIKLLDTRAQEVSARDDYQRKLEIIQNSLYGVDIDPFAVNIARLRLWLTLVVEYDGDNPEPLPNLDFKIEVGDSLTAPDPQGVQSFRDEVVKQYVKKKDEYICAHHPGIKKTLRKEINGLKKEISIWSHAGKEIEGFDWVVEFAEVFADRGFDIVIANPPYGHKCKDPLRFDYFPGPKEKQSRDSYGLFMARALQLLKLKGFFTFIVSDTWRTIKTHRPLRKRLIEKTTILHVLDLPPWIFGATVNTCILSLIKQPPEKEHSLIAGDLRNLPSDDWLMLETNLDAVAAKGPDVQTTEYARYTYKQNIIALYDNLSVFIASPSIFRLMNDPNFIKLGDVADVKVGLQTGDNHYYLRKNPTASGSYKVIEMNKLLTEEEIKGLSDDENINGVNPSTYNGRHFVPYDKGGASDASGGWLPNYFVPTDYYIDWSRSAVKRLKTYYKKPGSMIGKAVIRNPSFYFKRGVTFSDVGVYSPTFRLSGIGVFDVKGSRIILKAFNNESALGILCSKLSRMCIKCFSNHTVSTQVDDISELPFPILEDNVTNQIGQLVRTIVKKQKKDPSYAYHLNEQKEIDSLVYQVYSLNEEDIREIELWYCRRYSKLAEAQGALEEVKKKYAFHLKRCANIMSKPASYWISNPILRLIAEGESQKLELKETLEYNIRTKQKDKAVLISSLKTIAAFLNTEGGTLIIGVSDLCEIKGLEKDYNLCNKKNADGFELKLRSLLKDRFEPIPLGKVRIKFESLLEGEICRIDVEASEKVTHLDDDVYVRDGNTTIKLTGRKLTQWMEQRSNP